MSEAATQDEDTEVGGIAADRLRSIERIERLEEERLAGQAASGQYARQESRIWRAGR